MPMLWYSGLSLVALMPMLSKSAAVITEDFVCHVPATYSDAELQKLARLNCENVDRAISDFQQAVIQEKHFSPEQRAAWQNTSSRADATCESAIALLGNNPTAVQTGEAAWLALNAWGTVIVNGKECCTLLEPPYCVDQHASIAIVANIIPFAVLLFLFLASLLTSMCLRKRSSKEAALAKKDKVSSSASSRSAGGRASDESSSSGGWRFWGSDARSTLQKELEAHMLQKSCLRVLPGAADAAKTAASLFSSLYQSFDFQPDSVRNQFEHLLSLWRSQVAMVADRSVGLDERVDESVLLGTAIGDLHAELLDGFMRWRAKLSAYEPSGVPPRDESEIPKLAGAQWDKLSGSVVDASSDGDASTQLSARLAEISTFLLVWGEGGNVRFMPEVIYFITELALAAESSSLPRSDAGTDRSCHFLSNIMRPIYNIVFDEWYDEVSVNQSNQKDVKKLRAGYENFLPPNVANYDDWNELFCSPDRLVSGLLLLDGTPLFELPHHERFAALSRVDWQVSLLAAATKTHREVHSLWGVFASTHRVWLAHSVLFFTGLCIVAGDPPATSGGRQPLLGQSIVMRFAAVALVVPIHAMLWWCARWQITGVALRPSWSERVEALKGKWAVEWFRQVYHAPTHCERFQMVLCSPPKVFALLPIVTYAILRWLDDGDSTLSTSVIAVLAVHFAVSFFGLCHLLFVPAGEYNWWTLSQVPLRSRAVRYFFWLCVFAVKFSVALIILRAVDDTIDGLNIARLGHETHSQILEVYLTTNWWANILLWFALWATTFTLFTSDTQLWFTIACTVLGMITVFKQRAWKAHSLMFEHAMSKIPERFSQNILCYATEAPKKAGKEKASFSSAFPFIWDRIIAYMRYEDDIDSHTMCDLSFDSKSARDNVLWEDLQKPLKAITSMRGAASSGATVAEEPAGGTSTALRVKMPALFRGKNPSETAFKTYCCMPDGHEPSNADVRWRLAALGRGLALPMPRPYRAPFFPGITVLIPHYGEQILIQKKDLFQEDNRSVVPLMHWLKQKYEEEFMAFTNRMRARIPDWPVATDQWDEYTEAQWEKLTAWAAMRLQTLWRTVAGMCYYHPALQCHFEAQADRSSSLAQDGVWDPSDCFTCLVSMQMYKFFDKTQLQHTNRMFDKFPSCFKVAFIDCTDKGEHGDDDAVHPCQERRYYSCLIDNTCAAEPDGRKKPLFKIELPGYPILGDGKGDNQNHAIPFMRGHFSQCIDANQGAYFEQMMMLPCALGEFRSHARGDGLAKRIIGFPEHITSDIGSIGDFAASAEIAFGTILQRTYAVLGARMHYGHPDIMNKLYMMQQGGVSKATKTINLSEDIFAGMDFTLRGNGRQIRHCEYFHLAKGRDMGFNAVLGFFSKLSSGTGEQLLSRQTFRLGQVMHLPEALAFYYAHAGYYINQFFVSISMPLLVFAWLLVLLSDCEGSFGAFQHCMPDQRPAAEVMADFLVACFSWLVLLFLVANTLPLFFELWMEVNLKAAVGKFVSSILTLSPLMFIFQAKTIGHYIVNEFRYGGASYVATGRGLPTERRPFISKTDKGSYEGLYLDYAVVSYYDGAMLLAGAIMVHLAGGDAPSLRWTWLSVGLTIASWLYAPFIFNPYNFSATHFKRDMWSLYDFFFKRSGKNWDSWYERTLVKPRRGVRRTMNDIGFFITLFVLVAWYATINLKAEALITIYSQVEQYRLLYAAILLPPLCCSLVFCTLVVLIESIVGCRTIARRGLAHAREWAEERTARATAAVATRIRGTDAEQARTSARRDLGREAADEDVAGGASEAVETTQPKDGAHAPALPKGKTRVWEDGLPLAFSALVVASLDVAEAIAALYFFYWVGWNKAFMAGLILKWSLMNLCLYLSESMLRSSRCVSIFSLPLHHWVRAHRMARDMLVSLIIALPQLPLVVLNSLNDYVCPGCSAHQLLIYRDPGSVEREEKVFDLDGETEAEDVAIAVAPESEIMGSPSGTGVEGATPKRGSSSLWSASRRGPADATRAPTVAPPAGGAGIFSWLGGTDAKPYEEAAVKGRA